MPIPSSVPRPRRSRPRLIAVLAAMLLVIGGSAVNAVAQTAIRTATPTPTATATPQLQHIALNPVTASKPVGGSASFTATAFFSDGSQKNFTQKVVYSSSDLNVAFPPNEVGNAGKIDAVGIGTATIAALEPTTGISSNTSNESAVLTVVEPPTPTPTRTGATPTKTRTPTPTPTATPELVSISLSPTTAKRNVQQTQNFTATGTYSDGNTKNLTSSATFVSSNPSIAQAPNDPTNRGQVLAVGPGVATISATFAGVSSDDSGGSAEFTVVTAPTPTPTRTGATPTRTITPSPTISATPVLVHIALKPLTATKFVGAIQNYTVTAFFSDGSEKNFTQNVVYSSSDLNVAFPPNEVGNAGKVEAVGIGTATISALETTTGISSNASNESATIDVVPAPTPTPTRTGTTPTKTRTPTPTPTATPTLVSISLSPLTAKRNVDQSQNFTATGTYSDGNTKNLTSSATFASSDPSVAQAPNDPTNRGKVLAVGPGVATISASFSGVSSSDSGESAEFTVVTAPTPTPTRTGATPTRTITPSPTISATPSLVSLALSPTSVKKPVGGFQQFTATATFSDFSTKNFTQRVTYSSSNPSVVSAPNDPTNKGKVIAVAIGTATISATDADTGVSTTTSNQNAVFEVVQAPTPTPTRTGSTPTKSKTPTPTVTATPQLLTLTLSPATVKKAVGLFQVYSVSGEYSNGDVKNMTQKVVYASSNSAVAQTGTDPNSKSKVVAAAPGVATISATEPLSGIKTTTSEGDSVFTVVAAPTPTPTRTGPTSTGPTPTPTLSGSPTATATPMVVALTLKPKTAQKGVGGFANFTTTAKLSDGTDGKNVTQRVLYSSSDPTVAEAPNLDGNRGRVNCLAAGKVTITAREETTGVVTTSDGSAELSCVVGGPTARPRPTVTPGVPIQTGDNTTACQRDVRRAARTFVDKKLKALDRCSGAASRCIQRKPNDPNCLAGARGRCAAVLSKLADDEAGLIASVIRRCSALTSSDVLGQDGLGYGGDIGASCSARFGRTLTDVASVAQCLAAQHSCRVEELFAVERPRAGELLRLLSAAPDAGACRVDFGGG